MPRNPKRKPGSRKYRDYGEEQLLAAINDCRTKQVSVKDASKAYNIPIRTLRNKLNGVHIQRAGRPQALTDEMEAHLVEHLVKCAEYGMPLEITDIAFMVKAALDKAGVTVARFKNNLPGRDWIYGFQSRHKDSVTLRTCQNIKRSRGEVKPDDLKKYFKNLETSLKDVPPQNILNFDETNLADDPGQSKCLFKRGVKYPERIINYSKGNISVMFAGTASGELIPPYVIYKAQHLYDAWCERGPKNARFGRSKSGWMDMKNFEEWFSSIVVPWAKTKEGKKVIIGDNLSSHLSEEVTKKCREMDIAFVLLPPNSTDKCQPLDVSFFAPLKREWRKLLKSFKEKNPSSKSLDKSLFPSMLMQLMDAINEGGRASTNLVSGFRTCGIYPVDAESVLKKFPATTTTEIEKKSTVSEAVIEYLQQFKYSPTGVTATATKRKRVMVSPGKSICMEDVQRLTSQSKPIQTCPRPIAIGSGSARGLTSETEPSTSVVPSRSQSRESSQDSDSDSDEFVDDSDNDEDWHPPKRNKVSRNIFNDL